MEKTNTFSGIKKKCQQFFSSSEYYDKLLVALLVAFVLIGIFLKSNYWIRVLCTAMIYVLLSLGLNVVLGYTGLLHMGFAGYYAIGAYLWGLLASPQHGKHWSFWVVFPLAGLITGVLGYLVSLPIKDLRGDYFAVVTIGMGEIVRILINNIGFTNGALGIMQIDPIDLGFYKFNSDRDYFFLLVVVISIVVVIMKRLENSYIGKAWMAIREDETAAKAMGINTRNMKLLACFIGAVPAGLAGVIFASSMTYVNPVSFKSSESVAIISMVMVGGRGNVLGAVLGAILLTILPEPLRGTIFDESRVLIYGLLLIIIAVFRPQGFFPRRYGNASKELADGKAEDK